jgi:preprotein translocase subunit SecY
MRGRITSVSAIFIGSSNEIGEFESGLAAKLLGTVNSVFFGGTLTLITVAVVYGLCKELRSLDLSTLEKRL